MGGLRQGWGGARDLDSRGCLQGGLIQKIWAPPNSKAFQDHQGPLWGAGPPAGLLPQSLFLPFMSLVWAEVGCGDGGARGEEERNRRPHPCSWVPHGHMAGNSNQVRFQRDVLAREG